MPHYKIEYGRAPDGLFSMVGFQPPLSAEHATAVEGAVDDFLSQETKGSFLGVTRMIERTPDQGKPYTEFQAGPQRLDDDRAEAVGHRIVPELVSHTARALADHTGDSVSVQRTGTSKGRALFGGTMRVWYQEGRYPLLEPHQPIIGSNRPQAEPIVDTYYPQTGSTAIGTAEFEADGRNI